MRKARARKQCKCRKCKITIRKMALKYISVEGNYCQQCGEIESVHKANWLGFKLWLNQNLKQLSQM